MEKKGSELMMNFVLNSLRLGYLGDICVKLPSNQLDAID